MKKNIGPESKWIPESNVVVDNIGENTHPALYDTLIWQAGKEAIEINLSSKSALDALLEWNLKNDPKVAQKDLINKYIWLVKHLEYVPFPRNLGK
jgi:hypothetical protein